MNTLFLPSAEGHRQPSGGGQRVHILRRMAQDRHLDAPAHCREVSLLALLRQHRHRRVSDVGGQVLRLSRSSCLLLFPAGCNDGFWA